MSTEGSPVIINAFICACSGVGRGAGTGGGVPREGTLGVPTIFIHGLDIGRGCKPH